MKTTSKYSKVFGDWIEPLSSLIDSPYFSRLMGFLNKEYKFYDVYPEKKHVFKAFRETQFKDVRVVVIGDAPIDELYEGLAFGCTDDTLVYYPHTDVVHMATEKHCGINIGFDVTLGTWAKQGVLLLNTKLTNKEPFRGAHRTDWLTFIRFVINKINRTKTGIIFCFWGEEAKEFKDLVSEDNHFILECGHPSVSADLREEWNCNHFSKINDIIEKQNGKEFKIKW